MLKSEKDYIAISNEGNVRLAIKSDKNTYNFRFDENISITLKDKSYIVAQWVQTTDWSSSWIDIETFNTEHEAIMYGLTLV